VSKGRTPLEQFSTLLDVERKAALAADVDTLSALQDHKAAVLAEMQSDPPTAQQQAEIVRKAHANIGLVRQLAELHRALLVGEAAAPTYGPRGLTLMETTVSLRRP